MKSGRMGQGVADNRCTDNFPSIVESIPTQGSFTLEARPLGKTRSNNIERDNATFVAEARRERGCTYVLIIYRGKMSRGCVVICCDC